MNSLRLAKYWSKPISVDMRSIKSNINTSGSKIKRIIAAAMLSAVAAIMQSAGALGGPGFVISALVTLPVATAALLSVYSGFMAYAVTLCLLLILQPSELIIFPFTTGLLGLGIGFAFLIFKKRAAVTAFSAFSLTMGISVLLYIFRFPVLGPSVSKEFNIVTVAVIYAFSFLYSWLWVEISMISLSFLNRVVPGDHHYAGNKPGIPGNPPEEPDEGKEPADQDAIDHSPVWEVDPGDFCDTHQRK